MRKGWSVTKFLASKTAFALAGCWVLVVEGLGEVIAWVIWLACVRGGGSRKNGVAEAYFSLNVACLGRVGWIFVEVGKR